MSRLIATYRVACEASAVAARARAIALEQSVELPWEVLEGEPHPEGIAGRVEDIRGVRSGLFDVRISLSVETTGFEAGQLLNMLFGNTSIHEDVTLISAELPGDLVASFGGPGHGLAGLRSRAGDARRALTCTALKPQGLPSAELARRAGEIARGGVDFIKDDHGLADQAYSPFAERVPACARAVRQANRETGSSSVYVPNITGDLDRLREQLGIARNEGLNTVLIAPMIAGLANLHRLTRDFPDFAFIAHPAMAGASRIAPPLLLGRLFRLFGADATIFPNQGGRFGYTKETCASIAEAARANWHGLRPCAPVPAGGMSLERVPELLDFYGPDTMLLIGGSLLAAGDRLKETARSFARRVAEHFGQHV